MDEILFQPDFQKALRELQEFYERHRLQATPESLLRENSVWDPDYSSFLVDSFYLHLPDQFVKALVEPVRRVLTKWARVPAEEELRSTAVYGIRLYRNNSALRMHLDKAKTHVLSAMIPVARRGLRKPWSVEIRDHEGTAHLIDDISGSVVL